MTRREASTPATIAVACIAVAMLMLDISVINTALSDIAAGLDTGLSGLQWVIDAYTLPLAATVLTAGAVADRLGRRRLFVIGMALFTVSSAACGAASGIEMLVAARAVQGLGAAVLFATGLALIAQAAPEPEARTKALAVFGASIGAAFAIGPFVGGGLTELIGWRSIFLINVPVGAVALFIATRRIAESRDERARAIDWPGQVALIGGMFLLILGLLRGNGDGWGSAPIVASLGGAVVLLLGFGLVQMRSSHPMLPLRLLREPRFAGPQIVSFGMAGSFFALFLYITLYMQTVLGLSAIQTGLVYLPGTVTMFVISGLTAQFAANVDPARLAAGGLALTSIGMLMLLPLDTGSSWAAILPSLFVSCVGTGLFNPAASALALNALPAHQSGLASGANDLFRQTGVAVGIAALGTLVPAGAALGGDPQAYVDGFHHAVVAAGALAAAGAIVTAMLLLRRRAHGLAAEPAAEAA